LKYLKLRFPNKGGRRIKEQNFGLEQIIFSKTPNPKHYSLEQKENEK
jgi:hypothetical protein